MTDLEWHESTVAADYAHRAALAQLGIFWRKPVAVACLVLLSVLLVFAIAIAVAVGDWVAPVLVAGVPVAMSALLYWVYRRVCNRAVPPGSVLRLALGPTELLLNDPTGTAAIPYSAIRSVSPRGEFVVLARRGLRPIAIPTAVLPTGVLTDLRGWITAPRLAGVASSPASVPPAPGDLVKTFVPDDRFAGRVAWAFVRAAVLSSRRLATFVATFVVLAIAFYAVGGAGGAVYVLVVAAAYVGFLFVACRRAVRRQYPAGSPSVLVIGADGLRAEGPTARVEAPYSTFDRLERRGAVLLVRVRASRGFWALPADALTDDETVRLRASVQSA